MIKALAKDVTIAILSFLLVLLGLVVVPVFVAFIWLVDKVDELSRNK